MGTNGKGPPPVARRMLDLMADGMPHSTEELRACLRDELGDVNNIHWHLGILRGSLKSNGETIQFERINGRSYYRRVRFVAPTSAD